MTPCALDRLIGNMVSSASSILRSARDDGGDLTLGADALAAAGNFSVGRLMELLTALGQDLAVYGEAGKEADGGDGGGGFVRPALAPFGLQI